MPREHRGSGLGVTDGVLRSPGAAHGHSMLAATSRGAMPSLGSPERCSLGHPGFGLLRRLRVTRHGIGEPDDPVLVVDAIPEPTTAGDLVLPLPHRCAVDRAGTETPLEGVLAGAPVPRNTGDALPRHTAVSRGCTADLLPSGDGVARRIPEVPAARGRRGGDPLSPFGHVNRLEGPEPPRRWGLRGAGGGGVPAWAQRRPGR